MLQVITGRLNNTLFLPYRGSALFKLPEEKRGTGGTNSQNKIGKILITVGWTWGMGTCGFIRSGIPHPHTGACWEPGHTAGGERRKFHLYLRLLPSTGITTWAPPPSDQEGHQILTGAWTLLWTMLTRDLGCGLPMRIIPKPSPTPGSVENLSSMKLVSGAKKVGERCIRCCSALCIGGRADNRADLTDCWTLHAWNLVTSAFIHPSLLYC